MKYFKAFFLLISLLAITGTAYSQDAFKMVKNITRKSANGSTDCQAAGFTEYNGKVYFQANDGTYGTELWVTDGTDSGTYMLIDVNQGYKSSWPHGFTLYSGKLYFSAYEDGINTSLWFTNGASYGKIKINNIQIAGYPICLHEFNNKLFFIGYENTNKSYLWTSDGSTSGSHIFNKITPRLPFFNFNKKMYFSAADSINGFELWTVNGLDTGTKMVKNINLFGSSFPGKITSIDAQYSGFNFLNNKLYFPANDSVHGTELWGSDGTDTGTKIVKDINPSGWSYPGQSGGLINFNGKLYFDAKNNDTATRTLWVTNGTDTGTRLFGYYPNPVNYFIYNNRLYFNSMATSNTLLRTDGTPAGTSALKDNNGNSKYAICSALLKNKVYFISSDYELWVTDGSDTGTRLLKPHFKYSSRPLYNIFPLTYSLFAFKDSILLFKAQYGSGYELWSYNPAIYTAIANADMDNYQANITSKLHIFPNPVSNGELTLNFDEVDNSVMKISLSAIDGKIILQNYFTKTGNEIQLKLPNSINSGMYFLNIHTKSQLYNEKLIIQK